MPLNLTNAFNADNPDIDSLVDSMIMLVEETDDMLHEVYEESIVDAIFAALQGQTPSFGSSDALTTDLESKRNFILETVLPETLRAMDLDKVEQVSRKLTSRLIYDKNPSDMDDDLSELRKMNTRAMMLGVVQTVYGEKLSDYLEERRRWWSNKTPKP